MYAILFMVLIFVAFSEKLNLIVKFIFFEQWISSQIGPIISLGANEKLVFDTSLSKWTQEPIVTIMCPNDELS